MNLNINFFKNFFGYGIAIFPLLLLIGPFISELFLILSIFFSFFLIIKEKKVNFYKNNFFIFFCLFCLSTFFSTIINFYSSKDLMSGIFYFRIPLFAISIWFILQNYKIFDKKISYFYSLLFIILIFDSLLQFYSGKNLLGYEIYLNRISSFFGSELILGSFLLRILPIFLIYLILNETINEKKNNIFYILLISATCFIIYASGERTSFGLLILFFVTLFFISKYLRKLIIFVMIIFLALSVVLPNLRNIEEPNPASRMFKKSYDQFLGIGEEKYEKHKKKMFSKIYAFSHDHHGHYMLSLKIFKDHKIFGTGTKGFRYLCRNKIYILENNDGCSTHPHNTYFQILVSNGVIGFSLLVFALFYIILQIFICRRKIVLQNQFNKYETSKAIAISAIFINVWPIIPTGNFFNNWLSMLYFYPIGFYLYLKFINEKKTS